MLPSSHPRITHTQVTSRVGPTVNSPTKPRNLRYQILLAKSSKCRSGSRQAVGDAELVDAGGSASGGGSGVESGTEAADVDGHGGEHVLQMLFGHTPVTGVAQVRAADGFGDGALDPGAAVVGPA